MAQLTDPAQPRQIEVGRIRLVLLGLAAVLAPAVLLLQAVVRPDDQELVADLLDPDRTAAEDWADWTVRRPDGERVHPGRGLVPPEQFIALAEETGLIEQIGDWVLRQAVGAAGRWRRHRTPELTPYVSVNVSARQLRAGGLIDRVRSALAAADVPPTLLMLEITESLLLRDDDRVWAELTELRMLGVRVAIDDFGTGFSSLSYLQQMPADVIKIDRSFTATVESSRRQLLLLEGIIRLAGTLSLDTIAEGVETEVVRSLLTDMGCASGQGYLFSRPLGEEDATRWDQSGVLPPRCPAADQAERAELARTSLIRPLSTAVRVVHSSIRAGCRRAAAPAASAQWIIGYERCW